MSPKLISLTFIRDKDCDITWLFGPCKITAAVQSTVSRSLSQSQEPANPNWKDYIPKETSASASSNRSILLPPRPWLKHRPLKERVCLEIPISPEHNLTSAKNAVTRTSNISFRIMVASSSLQPEGSTSSLSPRNYLWLSYFHISISEAVQHPVRRRGPIRASVVRSSRMGTHRVATASNASQTHGGSVPAVFFPRVRILPRRKRVSLLLSR
jgi:hypothetical protein